MLGQLETRDKVFVALSGVARQPLNQTLKEKGEEFTLRIAVCSLPGTGSLVEG